MDSPPMLFKLVLTLLLVVCATGVKAFSIVAQFTIGGVTYTQIQEGVNTVSVTGQTLSESTALVIPDKVTNETTEYTVTSIGASAFINCRNLTSVTIPSSVTSIGDNAFNTSSLTSVTIPSSVTSIGTDAFYNCSKLATVTEGYLTYTIADTKATVTGWANSPKALTVPSKILGGAYSVTGIGDRAFVLPQPCNSLTSVTISEGVTSIGDWAFCGCTNLTTVTIPNSVTSIGNEALKDCNSLSSITYTTGTNSVYSTDGGVLFGNSKATLLCYPPKKDATSYTIPSDVTAIGRYAFKDCTVLTSVTIPNSVASIGEYAFTQCTTLETITYETGANTTYSTTDGILFSTSGETKTIVCFPIAHKDAGTAIATASYVIPYGVTTIGTKAFEKCPHLTSVSIPFSVTDILDNAFSETGLTSIVPPNSVTTIGALAFSNCTALTSVTIPNSVTNIGDYAFLRCSGLTAISAENPSTTISNTAFSGISSTAKLYVPKSRSTTTLWTNWTAGGIATGNVTARTADGRDQSGSETLTFTAADKPLTRYFHYPVDLPADVKAYTGALNEDNTKVMLTEITTTYDKSETATTYIPAGTPVLLYSTAEGEVTKTLTESSVDASVDATAYTPANATDKSLQGSITPTNFGAADKALTLGYSIEDEGVTPTYGFYLYNNSETNYTVPANRAFLLATQVGYTGGSAQGISISISEPTSIEDALADKKPAAIGSDKVYNLDGSLEMNPTTGTVYIVNGKKVIYI